MNISQAKQLHLRDVLARLGYEPARMDKGEYWYYSPLRDESDASFKITRDGRGWYDHGAGQGGNILDFVICYYELPEQAIREALRQLDALWQISGPQLDMYWPDRSRKTAKPLPEKKDDSTSVMALEQLVDLQHPGLLQYLAGRGISEGKARPFLQEMHYRMKGKSYFALAFPSDSGGYELRNAYFKGCYGRKDISVIRQPHSSSVAVFEGFMDFLSLIEITGRMPEQHVIVLNSGSMRERALDAIRSMELTHIALYLDHDAAGREMTALFQSELNGLDIQDRAGLYAGFKDANDYLVNQQKLEIAG